MKILHLLDIPWWSGLSAYAFDCVEAHQKLGHDVILACEKNSLPYKKAIEKNWTVTSIRGRGNIGGFLNFLSIGAILARGNPDWVIAHTGSTHWIAWFWSKFINVKVARTRATSQKLKKSFINRVIYSQTDRIIAASDHLRKECAEFISNQTSNTTVLYPPVIIPDRTPDNIQTKALGILARLDPVKGHSDLLRAFKIVQNTFPGAEMHLAGPEENLLWNDLLKEIEALNLKNVLYHGFLRHEQIWNFTQAFAIGIVSSIGSEEVSRALMEWMAQGKPVIATRVGCIPEILKEGEGGFLVPISNAEEMADKIKTLLINPVQCRKMGDFNRNLCENTYSMNNFCQSWKKMLAP